MQCSGCLYAMVGRDRYAVLGETKKITELIRKRNSKGTENELSSLPEYHKKEKTERNVISPSAKVRGAPVPHEGPSEGVDPASKDGSSPGPEMGRP